MSAASAGYDDKKLYVYNKDVLRINLVHLIPRSKYIHRDRLELAYFIASAIELVFIYDLEKYLKNIW